MATQAARTYIDGVRSGAIAAPSHTITLNEVTINAINSTKQFTPQRSAFAGVAAPTSSGSLNCTAASIADYPYCPNDSISSLYCIDLDSDGCSSNGVKDMVVQAFRSVTSNSVDADKGYVLGVRVYRADAFSDSTPLVKSDSENKRTQATFTGGLGNRKAPLVEMTTEISTEQTRFRDFCDRLGGCQ